MRHPRSTEKGKIAYEIIELAVEAAADMRMKMIMMPSFVDGFIDTDEELKNTAAALRYACDIAAPFSIIIASENLLSLGTQRHIVRGSGQGQSAGF
jgi:sugar phosphate isomerase/epimerase